MEADPDFDLLVAWREGDPAAGNLLFDRHFRSLHRFFRNKSSNEVDDLVQQTFLACVEARDRFQGHSSFRTYLFAAARNILFKSYRRAAVQAGCDPGELTLEAVGPTPSSALGRKADERILLSALRRLSLDNQIAIELYHFEGMTGPQLAEVLGLPEPAVRSRLRRALEQLREHAAAVAEDPTALADTQSRISQWARDVRGEVA
jgi:RNA polymerase sigma-70 factor (ECF subfamily)